MRASEQSWWMHSYSGEHGHWQYRTGVGIRIALYEERLLSRLGLGAVLLEGGELGEGQRREKQGSGTGINLFLA